MSATMRDAPLGQLLRLVSGNRFFRYQEELPDFQLPLGLAHRGKEPIQDDTGASSLPSQTSSDQKNNLNKDLEKAESHHSAGSQSPVEPIDSSLRRLTTTSTRERLEQDLELDVQRTVSRPIQPHVTNDGKILVTWYTTDDPENPRNWSQKKKSWVSFLIW